MALLDKYEIFSENQSIASAVGDVVSTNVYDTQNLLDVGIGQEMYVQASMVTALAGAGSSVQVIVQTSADNTTFVDAAAGPVVALANAGAGKTLAKIRLPHGMRRYIRLAYRVSGATVSAGTVKGQLQLDVDGVQYGATSFKV